MIDIAYLRTRLERAQVHRARLFEELSYRFWLIPKFDTPIVHSLPGGLDHLQPDLISVALWNTSGSLNL